MKNLVWLVLLLDCINVLAQQTEWDNAEIFGINTMNDRSFFIPSLSGELAKTKDRDQSIQFLLLSGNWKFHLNARSENRPLVFYKESLDTRNWKEVQVPGDWQIHGYDYPTYTNINTPFPKNKLFIDHSLNSGGSYKYWFDLTAS